MKKRFLFITLFIIIGYISKAQVYNIYKTSQGEFSGMFTLYDKSKDDIYGYIIFTTLDKVDKRLLKMKYEIIDKNFNEITSNEFISPLFYKKSKIKIMDVTYNKGHIFVVFNEVINAGNYIKYLNDSYKIIDIKKNKIVAKGALTDVYKETKDRIIKKKDVKNADETYVVYSYPIDIDGFFVKIYKPFLVGGKQNYKDFVIGFDGKYLWEKVYNNKNNYDNYYYLGSDSNYIYFIGKVKPKKNHTKKFKNKKPVTVILIKDIKTGKIIDESLFMDSSKKYEYSLIYPKLKNGRVYFTGRYKDKKKPESEKYWLGLYQVYFSLDKDKKIKQSEFKYLPFTKFRLADINQYGKILRKGFMKFVDMEMNDDGSMYIIGEVVKKKYRKGLYSFIVNKDFTMKKATVHNTKGTEYSKYLFSQDLINNKGKAFVFFENKSSRLLNINFIKLYHDSNKPETSVLKVNLRKSSIDLYPAKSGYIMLFEKFSRVKKGEKEIEFRLERID
jgi:hypothetical protein